MTYGYFHHSGAVAIKIIKKTICKSTSIFVRLLVLPLALAETIKLLGREAMHYYYEKVFKTPPFSGEESRRFFILFL